MQDEVEHPRTERFTIEEALGYLVGKGRPYWSAATRLAFVALMTDRGPMTARGLSRLVGLSPAAVNQACIRLYQDGAVERVYVLTDRGRAYAYQISQDWLDS